MAKDAPGMRGYRPRDQSGKLRKKRADTKMGWVEKEYHLKKVLARKNMQLGTYLKKRRVKSLKRLTQKRR